jgi:glycosyltransferase involved in cell wall biosynthesis
MKKALNKMNIAIIGTRGIPNHYGGFEQFAEYLSVGLAKLGHTITVYNSHNHPYQKPSWNGVKIIHCYDPEYKYGTIGQFIYDYNCILDTRKKKYDIILQLGYTSSSVWGWLLPRKKSIITTNMDGLEWKRTKFSKPTQSFLKFAEKLGIKYSDYLIADSIGIQQHIKNTYNKNSLYIPYGAHLFVNSDEEILKKYKVNAFNYNMLIARLEPENSIEIILDGVVNSKNNFPFLVIGKHETKFGVYLKNKFSKNENIYFMGGIYDINELNNLRYFSNLYFHGHSVGGTNPSLLEAMASNALICANDNVFNKSILGADGLYFKNKEDVIKHLDLIKKNEHQNKLKSSFEKIKSIYSWENIINQYLNHFTNILYIKNN